LVINKVGEEDRTSNKVSERSFAEKVTREARDFNEVTSEVVVH
jgi:hypothetical protein